MGVLPIETVPQVPTVGSRIDSVSLKDCMIIIQYKKLSMMPPERVPYLVIYSQRGYPYMYLPIVFLPLVGSSLAGLGGRFVGPTGASLITTTCLLLSLFLSCLCFYEVALCGSPCHIHLLD